MNLLSVKPSSSPRPVPQQVFSKALISQQSKSQKGFTLVELVSVVVLLGIIGIGLVNFIASSAEAYREVTRRDEIAQIGRFAVERVSRELRSALPGSVRTSGNCIEFVPVIGASIYTELPVLGLSPAADDFTVVNFIDRGNITRAAVYTVTAADVYNSANHIIPIDSPGLPSGDETTFNFTNPGQRFAEQSPGRRIYFIDLPVSFCIAGPASAPLLNRYADYGYSATQASPPNGGMLLAEFIQLQDGTAITPFSYEAGTLQRNGTVHLDFRFLARGSQTEWIRFNHDVALRGIP